MSLEEVIEKDGEDRRHKLCKCARCHEVARCTPSNDFYSVPDDPIGGLYCEVCFRVVAVARRDGGTPDCWV